jgi:hypothetical protein
MTNTRRRIFGIASLLLVTACAAAFVFIAFHRYPTDGEILARFGTAAPGGIKIDRSQADIGYFGIEINEGGENNVQYLETFRQWVFPGQSYDWSKAGY